MSETRPGPAIQYPRQLRSAERRPVSPGNLPLRSRPGSRMRQYLTGVLLIALGLAAAVATATTRPSDALYVRVGMPDVRNILLANTADSWDDMTLAWHFFGRELNGWSLDSFERQEMQQNAIETAQERRREAEEWKHVDKFEIGMVNVNMRGPGLSNRKVRFRRMQGYNEHDINHVNLNLEQFDIETSTFTLIENLLPCNGNRAQPVEFGHSFKHGDRLGFRPKKWPIASKQRDAVCRLHVTDEALARKIESARHRRTLIVGATLRSRLSGEMDGATHLLEVDEIRVDLFTRSELPFRDFTLASFTIPAPPAPEPTSNLEPRGVPAAEPAISTTNSTTASTSENPPALCNAIYEVATATMEEMQSRDVRARQTSLFIDFADDPEVAPTLEGIAAGIEALHPATPANWVPLLLKLSCTHGTHLAAGFRTRGAVVAEQCPREPEAQAITCAVQVLEGNSPNSR